MCIVMYLCQPIYIAHNAPEVLTSNRDGCKACTKFIHYRLTEEDGKLSVVIGGIDSISNLRN